MPVTADDAKGLWPVLAGACGFLLGVFGAGRKVEKFSGRLKDVEIRQGKTETAIDKLNAEIKARLYRADGSLIYVPAIDCEKMQANCAARTGVERIEKKVDQLIRMHMKDGKS